MNDRILPIGSVIQLYNGEVKLMILSRFPLYNNQGTIGYFDYSACLYPNGNTDNQCYFFNKEDISKVWFEGYIDNQEKSVQQLFEKEQKNIKYPHLKLNNIEKK